MEEFVNRFIELSTKYPFLKSLILSFIIMIIFYVIKLMIFSNINKKTLSKTDEILLKRRVTQYLLYLMIPSLILLWFTQLQVFFVSILAVAAAVVLAFKELIMCITGGTLIRISKVFKEGHRIEIDGLRGFVIEKSLLTTKILEIGPEKNSQQATGDIITIPNSLMLSKPIKNESYFKGYSIKSFIFRVSDISKVEAFENELLKYAQSLCRDYLEDAKMSISKFCEREGIFIPSVDPRTKIIIEDGKEIEVLVKLPVQNTKIADLEQSLNRFYLNWRMKNDYE